MSSINWRESEAIFGFRFRLHQNFNDWERHQTIFSVASFFCVSLSYIRMRFVVSLENDSMRKSSVRKHNLFIFVPGELTRLPKQQRQHRNDQSYAERTFFKLFASQLSIRTTQYCRHWSISVTSLAFRCCWKCKRWNCELVKMRVLRRSQNVGDTQTQPTFCYCNSTEICFSRCSRHRMNKHNRRQRKTREFRSKIHDDNNWQNICRNFISAVNRFVFSVSSRTSNETRKWVGGDDDVDIDQPQCENHFENSKR